MTCDAGPLAKNLLEQLTDGETFPTGTATPIVRPTIDQLTQAKVNGSGVFDVIMASLSAHLKAEYGAGRITGAEYAKVWTSSMEAALQQSVQFLTSVDNSYWQSLTAKATFALTTMKLASEDAQYCTLLEQHDAARAQTKDTLADGVTPIAGILKEQRDVAREQVDAARAQTKDTLSDGTTPVSGLLKVQKETAIMQSEVAHAQFADTLLDGTTPIGGLLKVQKDTAKEQLEVARSQTLDTRTDGSPVTGSVGTQRDLYQQQITSYKRSSEATVGKMLMDSWTAYLVNSDDTLFAPSNLTETNLKNMLNTMLSNLNMPTAP